MTKNLIPKNIIIGGLPRSGTTLISAVLDAQEDIAVYPHEVSLHHDYRYRNVSESDDVLHLLVKRLIPDNSSIVGFRDEFMDYLSDDKKINAEVVFRNLLEWWKTRTGQKKIWLYKHPGSIGAAEKALRLWPDTLLIYMVRDPRDIVVSTRSRNMVPSSAVRISQKWKKSLNKASLLRAEFPSRVLFLRYEDLVEKPERSLNKIFSMTGLNPDDIKLSIGCYEGFKGHNSRFEDVDGYTFSQVGVGRYLKKLEKKDTDVVNIVAFDEMKNFGYLDNVFQEIIVGNGNFRLNASLMWQLRGWELYDLVAYAARFLGMQYTFNNFIRKILLIKSQRV